MTNYVPYKGIAEKDFASDLTSKRNIVGIENLEGLDEGEIMKTLLEYLRKISEFMDLEDIELIVYNIKSFKYHLKHLNSYNHCNTEVFYLIFSIISDYTLDKLLTNNFINLLNILIKYYGNRIKTPEDFLLNFSQLFLRFRSQSNDSSFNYMLLNLALVFFEQINFNNNLELFEDFINEAFEYSNINIKSIKMVLRVSVGILKSLKNEKFLRMSNLIMESCLTQLCYQTQQLDKSFVLRLFLKIIKEKSYNIIENEYITNEIISILNTENFGNSDIKYISLKIIDTLLLCDPKRYLVYLNLFHKQLSCLLNINQIEENNFLLIIHIISIMATEAVIDKSGEYVLLDFLNNNRNFINDLIYNFDELTAFSKRNFIQIISFCAKIFTYQIIDSGIISFISQYILDDIDIDVVISFYRILRDIAFNAENKILLIIQAQMIELYEYLYLDIDAEENEMLILVSNQILRLFNNIESDTILAEPDQFSYFCSS